MADNTDPERGAQEVTTGEREAREQAKKKDDLSKPAEGRDTPPDNAGGRKRDRNSPWMGGG